MKFVEAFRVDGQTIPITDKNRRLAQVRLAQGAKLVTVPVAETHEDRVLLYGKPYADLQKWHDEGRPGE